VGLVVLATAPWRQSFNPGRRLVPASLRALSTSSFLIFGMLIGVLATFLAIEGFSVSQATNQLQWLTLAVALVGCFSVAHFSHRSPTN
jgi:hypothetical protein